MEKDRRKESVWERDRDRERDSKMRTSNGTEKQIRGERRAKLRRSPIFLQHRERKKRAQAFDSVQTQDP